MRFSLLFSYQTHYIIIIDAVIESKKRREPSTYLPYFNIFCSFDRSNIVNFKYLFFSWLDKCYFGNPHISFACWFVCLLGSCEMHTSGTYFDISTQNTNKNTLIGSSAYRVYAIHTADGFAKRNDNNETIHIKHRAYDDQRNRIRY